MTNAKRFCEVLTLVVTLALATSAHSQLDLFSKEQRVEFTPNGLIVNGAVRDVTGIQELAGFQVYTRGVDLCALKNVMSTGINVPIRMGDVTVMPGDIAIGDPERVTSVPPQLAEKLADEAEMDHMIGDWGHTMLREGKYTP